jgi:acid phosphatase type 7
MGRRIWIHLSLVIWLAFGAAGDLLVAESRPLILISFGDARFTDPANVKSSNPHARAALVARIAGENPDAILIGGDLPWHGGDTGDYDRFREETTAWRSRHLRIVPALGNHEFEQCEVQQCLEHWWQAFPDLRGKRWYATPISDQVEVLALDTSSPLTTGSEQRAWLEAQVAKTPPNVRFVVILMHHPAIADIQTRIHLDHNPRPNETTVADYLGRIAPAHRGRFLVVQGHVHNYERFVQNGVVYVASGGGGATPHAVDRTTSDLYRQTDFPNYHYLKMTVTGDTLKVEMFRLDDPQAPQPHFTVKDSFQLTAGS